MFGVHDSVPICKAQYSVLQISQTGKGVQCIQQEWGCGKKNLFWLLSIINSKVKQVNSVSCLIDLQQTTAPKMQIPLQKCFVVGCNACFPTHFGYVYHLMEEHDILVPALYSCEDCSQAMCDAYTFKARENWLINRMFARYKVALKTREKNGDTAPKMLPTEDASYLEPQVIITEENGDGKNSSCEYMCFVHGCNSKYGRKHQFKMHMLNAHGLCIVQNEFCQFCSDVLDQFYHFGRKLKGGYKRKAVAAAAAAKEPKTDQDKTPKRKKMKEDTSETDSGNTSNSRPALTDDFDFLVDEFLKTQRLRKKKMKGEDETEAEKEEEDVSTSE